MRRESEKWDPDPQSLKKQDPDLFNADLNPANVEACRYMYVRSLPSKVVSNVVCDIVSIPHLLE